MSHSAHGTVAIEKDRWGYLVFDDVAVGCCRDKGWRVGDYQSSDGKELRFVEHDGGMLYGSTSDTSW